jgi:hypothetical protein
MSKETVEETYIRRPIKNGQIAPKLRGACRHLLGQYDPEMHAICNALVMMTMNESLYSAVGTYGR